MSQRHCLARSLAVALLLQAALVAAAQPSAWAVAEPPPVPAADGAPTVSVASTEPPRASPRRARPWAVRADAFGLRGSGSGLTGATADSFGLSVQKTFFERWAWEETVAWGVGNRPVEGKDVGLNLAGTLRFAALMSAARSSALSLGLGSALMLGGGYGHLNFVYTELGYEYRARDGLSLLLTAGPSWLVGAPGGGACRDAWLCGAFHRGDFSPFGHARAGVGWAF